MFVGTATAAVTRRWTWASGVWALRSASESRRAN